MGFSFSREQQQALCYFKSLILLEPPVAAICGGYHQVRHQRFRREHFLPGRALRFF